MWTLFWILAIVSSARTSLALSPRYTSLNLYRFVKQPSFRSVPDRGRHPRSLRPWMLAVSNAVSPDDGSDLANRDRNNRLTRHFSEQLSPPDIRTGEAMSPHDASKPFRIVLISGFETFNRNLYRRAADKAAASLPGELEIFVCTGAVAVKMETAESTAAHLSFCRIPPRLTNSPLSNIYSRQNDSSKT